MAHPLDLACAAHILNRERKIDMIEQRSMIELQRILGNGRCSLVKINQLRRHVFAVSQFFAERQLRDRTNKTLVADYRLVDNAYFDFIHYVFLFYMQIIRRQYLQ
jgi:hypothetical protein